MKHLSDRLKMEIFYREKTDNKSRLMLYSEFEFLNSFYSQGKYCNKILSRTIILFLNSTFDLICFRCRY